MCPVIPRDRHNAPTDADVFRAVSLVELLRRHAEPRADKTAFTFTVDGETEHGRLSYAELDLKARAIVADLPSRRCSGHCG